MDQSTWGILQDDKTTIYIQLLLGTCERHGGLMVSGLDSRSGGLGSSPGRDTALWSWARHFSLVVPLFIQGNICIKLYEWWVPGLAGGRPPLWSAGPLDSNMLLWLAIPATQPWAPTCSRPRHPSHWCKQWKKGDVKGGGGGVGKTSRTTAKFCKELLLLINMPCWNMLQC